MAHDVIDEAWRDHRRYVLDVAFRMLGSITDAEDVVQEAFTRLWRVDAGEIDDVRAWLVVVVTRLCLDQLRSARSKRDEPVEELPVEPPDARPADPADRVTLADSVQLALLVVLERLSPAERAVFVLHDVFQFSFEAVAEIVGRTPAACRQLASRARRHIEAETEPARFHVAPAEQNLVAERFIAAAGGGDVDALMELLDPDVGGEADLGPGLPRVTGHGRRTVATRLLVFFGPQSGATLVSVPMNGEPGIMAIRDGRVVALLSLGTRDGLIHDLHAVADPQKLGAVTALLGGR
ncbi:MAG TPA: sigma-70 family RNA polymerase sigma factor [Acidimicrobiales bacterium]|nr:sigma-70 family RNA polymerase sigma factor [Acidimicrobiales bacterium]